MKITFTQDIANRKRGQSADIDDESAWALIASGVARDASAEPTQEETLTDPSAPETAPKPRRR